VGGAIIGGTLGAIGGVFGFGSSKKKRKARRLAKQSRAIQNLILRKGVVTDYVQQEAVAAMSGVASGAGTQSTSGVSGVMTSLQVQARSALKVNQELFRRNESIQKLEAQAAKYDALQSGIGSLISSAGSFLSSGGIDWSSSKGTYAYNAKATAGYTTQANAMGVHTPQFP
jgi:gas vesicle protein